MLSCWMHIFAVLQKIHVWDINFFQIFYHKIFFADDFSVSCHLQNKETLQIIENLQISKLSKAKLNLMSSKLLSSLLQGSIISLDTNSIIKI